MTRISVSFIIYSKVKIWILSLISVTRFSSNQFFDPLATKLQGKSHLKGNIEQGKSRANNVERENWRGENEVGHRIDIFDLPLMKVIILFQKKTDF